MASKTLTSKSPKASASKSNKRPAKVALPTDYRPSEDEPFMNPRQREYFRRRLLSWRSELLQEANHTLQHLTEENLQQPDMADRASLETEHAIELRTRD